MVFHETIHAFPDMEAQSENIFAERLTEFKYLLSCIVQEKGKTRYHFDTLWSMLLGYGCGSGLKRVVVVGRHEALKMWSSYFPLLTTNSTIKKKTMNRKKRKGDKRKMVNGHQTHEHRRKLPDYLLLVRYDLEEASRNDEYEINCSISGGDLVLLLPGCPYRASSVTQRGKDIDDGGITGDVVIVGLGSIAGYTTSSNLHGCDKRVVHLFNDCECHSIASSERGGRICLVNLHIGILMMSDFEGFLVAREGSAMRLLSCTIRMVCNSFGSDLIEVEHGGTLLAEGCTIGPSTKSGILFNGKCTVTLRKSGIVRTGGGDEIQRIDRIRGIHPTVIEGRFPAIAVSFAANVRLEDTFFVDNYGYPIQWTDANEEEGKTDWYILEESTSPEEYADERMKIETDCIDENYRNYLLNYYLDKGIDIMTPEGRASYREDKIKMRKEELAQTRIKQTKGYVESCRCNQYNNALSRYLVTEQGPDKGSIPVRSWFDSESILGKMIDREGDLIDQDFESPEVHEDMSEWKQVSVLKRKPNGISATASLFRSMVKDKDLQSKLSSIFRNCRNFYPEENSQQLDFEDRSEAMDSLRERLTRKCSEMRLQICTKMVALDTTRVNSNEAKKIVWGALAQIEKYRPEYLMALGVVVALHSDVENSISRDRAHVLVTGLERDDTENSGCDCEYVYHSQAVIQVLSELHSSIADALINLLGNVWASAHGRCNAAKELVKITFRQPNLRRPTIEAISASIIEQSDFTPISRGMLVNSLHALQAKECSAIVRKAFKRDLIDLKVCGGYIDYLLAVSLPVDTKDKLVRDEVKSQLFLQRKDKDHNKLDIQSESEPQCKMRIISEHNQKLGNLGGYASNKKQSCSFCGKKPLSISICSRCNVVAYCGRECQTADWKYHKCMCKSRKSLLDPGYFDNALTLLT